LLLQNRLCDVLWNIVGDQTQRRSHLQRALVCSSGSYHHGHVTFHPHVFAETIVRTVEKLAAQNRVLMCPICDRRLVQIEQMVAQQQNAAVLSSLTPHIGI
jgi:hypothetical protein